MEFESCFPCAVRIVVTPHREADHDEAEFGQELRPGRSEQPRNAGGTANPFDRNRSRARNGTGHGPGHGPDTNPFSSNPVALGGRRSALRTRPSRV